MGSNEALGDAPLADGVVVVYVPATQQDLSEHERSSLLGFARRLAALRGCASVSVGLPPQAQAGPRYFLPSDTLTSAEAATLGIAGPQDLFGGVVPHAFVATKAIGHPRLQAGAAAVAGWSDDFARRVQDTVLAGYTVFDRADARTAGERLLARGPVRLKPVRARGGLGQSVAPDLAALEAQLAGIDAAEVAAHGLVLEENLQELHTFSVGQVRVGDLVASYFGRQHTTRNNYGSQVFGGSDLTVARGGFDALLALQPPVQLRMAIDQVHRYEAAVRSCFPGFYTSRSNYDVLVGRDAAGRPRSAVLEQSWRAGGATGAEIAALEAFRADPARASVRASCHEVFGDSPEPPAGAAVYFRGRDPRSGPLTKYTVLHPR